MLQLAPRIVTKASSVDTHLSVHLGMGVEIETKPVNPDAPQVHIHPTPERLRQTILENKPEVIKKDGRLEIY